MNHYLGSIRFDTAARAYRFEGHDSLCDSWPYSDDTPNHEELDRLVGDIYISDTWPPMRLADEPTLTIQYA